MAEIRGGRSAVLVVRGEAGIGRTALLDHLAAHVSDCRTIRAGGSEAEMELPFAGLHQLVAPLLDDIDHLFTPQREALDIAFGLVYGEWLRRANGRGDARERLRPAYEMLAGFGAVGFTDRAARELRATGEAVARRDTPAPASLTAQERQIAGLARDGLTNPEIGARLFLSPHTVEWHLRKVLAKLGVTSRRQLGSALADGPPTASVRDD
ncbi:LuxR C-terminal-related transcriptional regulator [Streptomyces bobili]|uniref:helix-turn-helix transcriptional regulator n=1 Tax=Streptomyces bobili TaxID=67280 RepID=UPI0036E4D6BD